MRLTFCCACGTDDRSVLEHHHLVPRSEGGPDDEVNLITLCCACHGKVHGIIRKDMGKLTKAGIARAKAKGVKFGIAGKDRARENKAEADAFADGIRYTVRELQAAGAISIRALVVALNEKGIKARRGGQWDRRTVWMLLARLNTRCCGRRAHKTQAAPERSLSLPGGVLG